MYLKFFYWARLFCDFYHRIALGNIQETGICDDSIKKLKFHVINMSYLNERHGKLRNDFDIIIKYNRNTFS